MGGNVRVGLEDSLWLGRGQLAKSNAEQVAKARRILEELGLVGGDAGRRARDAEAQRRKECRLLGFCCLFCISVPGSAQDWPTKVGQVRLAVPAGRLGRSAGAPVRGEAHRLAQAAVHRREPHRRLGHHRHRLRGEERARRLHLRASSSTRTRCIRRSTRSCRSTRSKDFAPVMLVGYAPMAITTAHDEALQELRRRASPRPRRSPTP